jgi:hypothetical protein
VQATLKQRDDEVSRLNGELTQLSVSHEDLRQSLEEQEARVLNLRQAAKDARQAFEAEKKQVEGELSFACLLAGCFVSFWGSAPNFSFLVYGFQACGSPWGTQRPKLRLCRWPTTPRNMSWRSCGLPPSRPARRSRKARRKLGARWQVSFVLSAGMSLGACAAPFIWALQKALSVVASHYQVDFEAVSSGYVVSVGVEDEVVMNRADALAATAADMLTEDFTDFLFPDAPAAGGPQA